MELQISDLLRNTAGTDCGVTFVEEAGEQTLSYRDLLGEALLWLGAMQKNGLAPGDQVVFQIAGQRSFLCCFWSCILGGMLPVPLPVCTDDEKLRIASF